MTLQNTNNPVELMAGLGFARAQFIVDTFFGGQIRPQALAALASADAIMETGGCR